MKIEEEKRVLIIPDVHLKPWIFDRAEKILASGKADMAVDLGDLVDDFGKEYELDLYRQTLERAAAFHQDHPDTLWCIGNHDFSYMHDVSETGFSGYALYTAKTGIFDLFDIAGDRVAYVHRIGDCIFSHAGLAYEFVWEYCGEEEMEDVDRTVDHLNRLKPPALWVDNSPIWLRPLNGSVRMYMPKMLQITGHTPVKEPVKKGNLLIFDNFSTYRDGRSYGNERLCIIDTGKKTWKYAE